MIQTFSFREFLRTLSRFRKVLGPRGMRWLLACFLSSLSLSLIEYAVAGFLQVFLVSLGYFDRTQIGSLLLPLVSLSTLGLCGLLVVIGPCVPPRFSSRPTATTPPRSSPVPA